MLLVLRCNALYINISEVEMYSVINDILLLCPDRQNALWSCCYMNMENLFFSSWYDQTIVNLWCFKQQTIWWRDASFYQKILYEHCMTKPKLTECVTHIRRKYRRQWHKNSYFPFLLTSIKLKSMQIKKKNTNNSDLTHN